MYINVGGEVFEFDDEDLPVVLSYRWSTYRNESGQVYLSAHVPGTRSATVVLHRILACAGDGDIVDHADRDSRNNRRSNLRLCDKRQNAHNSRKRCSPCTSRYKGVHVRRDKPEGSKRWIMQFKNGDLRIRESFRTEEESAAAYDRACGLAGRFAATNAELTSG